MRSQSSTLYGALDDLDAFVRAVVAPFGWILVSALTLVAYLLGRRLQRRTPTAPARSHRRTAGLLAWLVGLMATAIAMYVIDFFWPWPNLRLTQFAIIASGLIGPAIIAALLLLRAHDMRRRLFATLLLALTSFAAWL